MSQRKGEAGLVEGNIKLRLTDEQQEPQQTQDLVPELFNLFVSRLWEVGWRCSYPGAVSSGEEFINWELRVNTILCILGNECLALKVSLSCLVSPRITNRCPVSLFRCNGDQSNTERHDEALGKRGDFMQQSFSWEIPKRIEEVTHKEAKRAASAKSWRQDILNAANEAKIYKEGSQRSAGSYEPSFRAILLKCYLILYRSPSLLGKKPVRRDAQTPVL